MLTAPALLCFLMAIAYYTAFSASSSGSRRARFNYRNLKADDIKEVAELCADCFDGPFGLVQFLQRGSAIKNFRNQIESRYRDLVLEGLMHTMIVCADTEAAGEIVGFLECGMLPPPPSDLLAVDNTLKVQASEEEIRDAQDEVRRAIAEAAKELEEAEKAGAEAVWVPASGEKVDEVPYLGNVAVKETARRQGLGQSLVKLGMKIAQKEQNDALFVIVDVKNGNALSMYDKLGFCMVLDERGLISRRGREPRVFLKKELSKGTGVV